MRLLILAVGLLACACGPTDPVAAGSEAAATAPSVAGAKAPAAQDVATAPSVAGAKAPAAQDVATDPDDPRAWFIGHAWVLEGEPCASHHPTFYDVDGRYRFMEEEEEATGRWTLDGARITFQGNRGASPVTWTLRQVEDGVAELRHEDGTVLRTLRCPPVS